MRWANGSRAIRGNTKRNATYRILISSFLSPADCHMPRPPESGREHSRDLGLAVPTSSLQAALLQAPFDSSLIRVVEQDAVILRFQSILDGWPDLLVNFRVYPLLPQLFAGVGQNEAVIAPGRGGALQSRAQLQHLHVDIAGLFTRRRPEDRPKIVQHLLFSGRVHSKIQVQLNRAARFRAPDDSGSGSRKHRL